MGIIRKGNRSASFQKNWWCGATASLHTTNFFESELFLFSELCDFLFHIYAHQAGKVPSEVFLFGLGSEWGITITGHKILWYLKIPEGIQGPAWMPDGSFTAIENLVLTAPEHQFAYIFCEVTWRSHDKVQGCSNGRVQVWKAYQLPANLIDEGQANVEDDEVDIREVGGGPIHIPGLGGLNRLWAQRYAFMHAYSRHAQFKRLLKYRKSNTPIIHAPGERLAIVIAHVIELERFCSVLFDLAFHQVKCSFALQWIN